MENEQTDSLNVSLVKSKNKEKTIKYIVKQVEKGTGHTIKELKHKYSDKKLFFEALKHVTTTKKALCKSLNLEIDNACRDKRDFEKKGVLIQSVDRFSCPYSTEKAHLLTTNPEEFEKLTKSNQLKLF